jgi:hypothetical protein
MARSLRLALLALLVCAPSPCIAQDAPREQARARFMEANALLDEGRFAEARDLLREALALYALPAIAQNLIVALRGVGDSVGASEIAARLAGGEYGSLDAAQAAELASLRASIEAEIAVLSLRVCGGDGVVVRIDGERWDRFDGCRDLERRVNAGVHVLRATGARRQAVERRLELSQGERLALDLRLAEVPTGVLIVRVPAQIEVEVEGVGRGVGGFRRTLPAGPYRIFAALDPPEERRVLLEGGASLEIALGLQGDPWPWAALGIGLGVLVLGGAAALIAYFAIGPTRPLIEDPIFGVTETLGVRW